MKKVLLALACAVFLALAPGLASAQEAFGGKVIYVSTWNAGAGFRVLARRWDNYVIDVRVITGPSFSQVQVDQCLAMAMFASGTYTTNGYGAAAYMGIIGAVQYSTELGSPVDGHNPQRVVGLTSAACEIS